MASQREAEALLPSVDSNNPGGEIQAGCERNDPTAVGNDAVYDKGQGCQRIEGHENHSGASLKLQ